MDDEHFLTAHDGALPENLISIAEEFRAGFAAVDRIDRPAVSLFGSARLSEDSEPYRLTREGGGRAFGRLQHRVAPRAGLEPLSRHLVHLQALLRAQGVLREAGGGLRHLSRRLRHARRALRGLDADPDG